MDHVLVGRRGEAMFLVQSILGWVLLYRLPYVYSGRDTMLKVGGVTYFSERTLFGTKKKVSCDVLISECFIEVPH